MQYPPASYSIECGYGASACSRPRECRVGRAWRMLLVPCDGALVISGSSAGQVTKRPSPAVQVSSWQRATATSRIGTGIGLDAKLAEAKGRLMAANRTSIPRRTGSFGHIRMRGQARPHHRQRRQRGRLHSRRYRQGSRGYAHKIDDGALQASDVAIIGLLDADRVMTLLIRLPP